MGYSTGCMGPSAAGAYYIHAVLIAETLVWTVALCNWHVSPVHEQQPIIGQPIIGIEREKAKRNEETRAIELRATGRTIGDARQSPKALALNSLKQRYGRDAN